MSDLLCRMEHALREAEYETDLAQSLLTSIRAHIQERGDIVQAARWLLEGERVSYANTCGHLYLDRVNPGDDPTVFLYIPGDWVNPEIRTPWNPSPVELLYTNYVRCE